MTSTMESAVHREMLYAMAHAAWYDCTCAFSDPDEPTPAWDDTRSECGFWLKYANVMLHALRFNGYVVSPAAVQPAPPAASEVTDAIAALRATLPTDDPGTPYDEFGGYKSQGNYGDVIDDATKAAEWDFACKLDKIIALAATRGGQGTGEHGSDEVPDRDGADGTERLCRALYGRKATARDYCGGSNARMLHDAADRIAAPPPDLSAREALVARVQPMAAELATMRWPKESDEIVGRAIRLLTDLSMALAPGLPVSARPPRICPA